MQTAILVAIVVLSVSITQARAYCVYNDTQQYLPVYGEFCGGCLSTMIAPQDKACCPGDKSGCRGDTWITVQVPSSIFSTKAHYKHVGRQVPAHGWVRINGAGEMLSGTVFNEKGGSIWSGGLEEGKKQ